jgi:hypothetical protein
VKKRTLSPFNYVMLNPRSPFVILASSRENNQQAGVILPVPSEIFSESSLFFLLTEKFMTHPPISFLQPLPSQVYHPILCTQQIPFHINVIFLFPFGLKSFTYSFQNANSAEQNTLVPTFDAVSAIATILTEDAKSMSRSMFKFLGGVVSEGDARAVSRNTNVCKCNCVSLSLCMLATRLDRASNLDKSFLVQRDTVVSASREVWIQTMQIH